MNRDKSIFLGIIFILLIFMTCIGILVFKEKKEETITNSEAIIFKNEYESLNNIVNENNGKTYKELNIGSSNPVDILSEEEAVSMLQDGTGIIYMGFPECPWCRNMVPVLLRTLENMNIDKLYYLNIKEIRDTLVLNEKNKAMVTREGTQSYYKMLEIMDDVLEPYYLVNNKGKQVDTKEKRIYAPTVVFVKEGKILGIHVSTVDSQTDPYEDLTKEQEEELSTIFVNLISKIYEVNCDEAC